MKHIQSINEAVGTINERRASAESLLKAVSNGDSTEVEGIKLSKAMANAFLDWLRQSTYGKKFGALPFYKLFTASFNWGIDRYIDSKLKGELKELKAKAKSMKESKELNESKFNKKKLIKAMKKDDGLIMTSDGGEYVIYKFGNGNNDNDAMWNDKSIFALDKDGEEHEIEYSDIVSYNESTVNEAEFKHINKTEHAIKLAIKDVEKKARLKANRDKPLEYEQLSLNKIMLSKVLGREKLGKEHQAAWKKLKKEYSLKESIVTEGQDTIGGLNKMANTDLERISDYADMIKDRMSQGQTLDAWMYSKISDSVKNLNSVHDTMDGNDGVDEGTLIDLRLVNENVEDEIELALTNWLNTLADGNAVKMTDLYLENGVLLGTVAKEIKQGRQAIQEYFEMFLKKSPIGSVDSFILQNFGDVCISDGTYTFEIDGEGGNRESVAARYTYVWKKENKKWMIATHHSSVNP